MSSSRESERRRGVKGSGLSATMIAFGAAIGVGAGSVLGVVIDDVSVGIGFGIGLGLAGAVAVSELRKHV